MPQPPPDNQPAILKGDLSEELLAAYTAAGQVAVDTETMGLNLLRDRLCVVQMCDRAGRGAVVQIPAFGPDAPPPAARAPRLKRLMEDPSVLKVFHFARFDVAALGKYLGIRLNPLYCTRTASKLVRTYTDRHGLKDCVYELLDVEMDKAARHTDWSSPSLSPEQVRYAISDVTLLLPLMDKLDEMLRRQDRVALAADCFKTIPVMAALDLLEFANLFEH